MRLTLILVLIIMLLMVILALQNSDPLVVKVFFWEVKTSLAIMIPLAVLFGALLGVLVSVPRFRKTREQNKRSVDLAEDQGE